MGYPQFEADVDAEALAQLRTDKTKLTTALLNLTRTLKSHAPIKTRQDCAGEIEAAEALLAEMGVA